MARVPGPPSDDVSERPNGRPLHAAGSGQPDEHRQAAGFAAVAMVVLVSAAAVGAVALLVATALLQAALIIAWAFGTGMPGRNGAVIIGAGAAIGSDIAISANPDRGLAPLLIVLGLAVPVMFVHQLARGVVRVRTTESLSKVALLVVAVTGAAAFPQLRHEFDGGMLAVAATVTVTVALLVSHLGDRLWSRPRFDPAVSRGLFGVVAGIVVGGACGAVFLQAVDGFGLNRAAWVAPTMAAVATLLSVGAGFIVHGLPETRPADPTADTGPYHEGDASLLPLVSVLLPLALSAPAAYLLCVAGHG
jgi:hypothetical protein